MMPLQELMLLSGQGRAALSSPAHPRAWIEEQGLWVLRDAPKAVKSRNDAFFTTLTNASQIKARLPARDNFSVHVFTGLETDITAIETDFLQTGFEISSRYYAIEHDLHDLQVKKPSWHCEQVTSELVLEQLNRLQGRRLATIDDIQSGRIHVFAAFDGLEAIAWVCGFVLNGQLTWDDDLFTLPKYRGQGVAVELMNAIHGFERSGGFKRSLSFSSETLYPYHQRYGYQKLAWKLRFVPKPNVFKRGVRALKRLLKH